LRSTDRLD